MLGKTALGGSGRGLAQGVLSSIQGEDKIRKGLYPRTASSEGIRAVAPQRSLVMSARETACGSVAVLYLPVSVKPKNPTRGTLRICPQTAGTVAALCASLPEVQFAETPLQPAEGRCKGPFKGLGQYFPWTASFDLTHTC